MNKRGLLFVSILLILVSSAYAASQKYDVPSGKTGSMVCDELGGLCTGIDCLKSQIIINIWGDCGRDQENRIIDCNFPRSSIRYNKVRASCSCTKENICYNGMSYEKNSDCTLGKILDNCAAKDMKCNWGECAGCIDDFVIKDEKCVPCDSLGGTWDVAARRCNYCLLPIPSDAGKKIKKGVPTQASQVWVYDNTESNSCSWNCSSGYVLSGTTCVSLSSQYSCASPAPMEDYKRINPETNLLPTKSNQEWIYDGEEPYDACSWRCSSGYIRFENRCVRQIDVEIKSIDSNPKEVGYVNQEFTAICESSIPNVNFTEAFVYSVSNKLESPCVFVERSWDNSKANFTCSSSITGSKTLKCTINGEKAALQNYKQVGTNKTKQILITEPSGQTKCGDGITQTPNDNGESEKCDPPASTKSCTSIDSSLYSSGEAACKGDCSGWNTAKCVSKTTIGCGNGQIDPGENCDDGNIVNEDGCSSTCQDEVPGAICDNDILETGELCDKGLLNEIVCTDLGFTGGTLSCDSNCQFVTTQCTSATGCGNGIVEPNLGEDCDCETDNACTLTELGLQGDSCLYYYNAKSYSPENRPYPNKKVSCFPSTSSNELKCKWNAQGCNSGYDVCLEDADCPSGNYCDLSVDYCKQKCTQDEPCIIGVCTGKKICNTQTGILSNTCTKDDSACGVVYQCVGNAPAHAQLCEGDSTGLTSETQMSLVQACTSVKCEYTCEQEYSLQSGQCVQQTLIPCGEGQIPTTGCQCPEGTPRYSGYCCKNAQNNFVYSPDVPCGQTQLSGPLIADFKYEKVEGTTIKFTSLNPLKYFVWDFGDQSEKKAGGDLSTVSHTYIFDGLEKSFNVKLVARNFKDEEIEGSRDITITKDISDLPDTETCNVRGKSLDLCHSSLDGCFLGSECESCAIVSTCDDFSNDELACTGQIPGCDRYACDWDNGNVCLPAQVSEQDCQYVCINLDDYPNYYFNGKKEYPQTCETGTCWECPTEGCKFTSPDGGTTITYIDGECVNGFKEVTIKNPNVHDTTIVQPCSLSPVIPFFSLFNIILTLSILTIFYVFRKKF